MIQIRGLIAPALAIVASLLGASTASAQAPLCYTLESLQGSYGTVSYFGDNIALGLASRYHDANGNFATAFVVNQPAAGSTTGVRNLVTGTNKGSDTVNCDGSGVVSRTLTLSDGTTSQAFDDLLITEGTVQNGKLIATAVTDMQRIPSTIVPGGVFIIRKYTRRPDTRTAGCYTLASLQGSYGVQVYYGANVALGLQAEILDGKGNLTRTGLLNQPTAGSTTGARTIGPVTSTGTYTVNCDGSGTISRIVTRPDGTTATALDDFLVTAGTEKDGQLTATTIFDAQRDPSVILPGGVFVFRSHTLRPAQGTGPNNPVAPPAAQTVAVAGPKNAAVTARSILLDGTQSTSADGKALTYSWTMATGSPVAAILGATTATPSVQFSLGRGTYTFQLTVTDSAGKTAVDTVTVSYVGN